MNVLVVGEGAPLLMLHGYLSSKETFYYQTSYFSKFFKIYAPDLSGFKENFLPYPYELKDYAKEVSALIEIIKAENDCEKVNVIAHSFGARIVFYLSPTNVFNKIVLTGAAGVKTKKRLSVKLKILAYKSIKRLFHKELKVFESEDYKRLSPVMKQSFKKIIALDLTDKLSTIKNETLIINGRLDKETPPKTAVIINEKIKNSTLFFIENAGHFCFIDEPIEFNQLVKEFLL
ncbi:MAG: alpha/beta hydrolase [Clostridia bacterium]|nr:alpha/beta hydrolase [Clostridia bacterium]